MFTYLLQIYYRLKLRRIYELRNSVEDPLSSTACFSNIDSTLITNRVARKMYRDLEMQLRGLDSEAWPFLKQEIIPLLTIKDPKRGWTQLFNRLNQANAYNYLASIGCTDIKFIPCAKDRKTPDLQAQLLSRKVLCEVKTINISEDEAEARTFYKVRNIELSLNDKFFNKLRSDLDQAKSQMADYCLDVNAKRVVYIIINFDDLLHEYADNYSAQINQYIANNPISNLEVVLDIKPPFYVASA